MNTAATVERVMLQHKNLKKAKLLAGFFKTGKDQYGEGDIFWGITVPQTRTVAKKFNDLLLPEIKKLLSSPIHELRLCSLFIVVAQFHKAKPDKQKQLYNFYIANARLVNNWDLVDSSAHKIVGVFLESRDRKVLYRLACSSNLWERRIAMISCYHFIKKNDFPDALKIATLLLNDRQDLMHKAVGWMLREIGNRDMKVEKKFLNKHYKKMPRTMLRYAIEKFPETGRKKYLKGTA